jgi:hypothetical protein
MSLVNYPLMPALLFFLVRLFFFLTNLTVVCGGTLVLPFLVVTVVLVFPVLTCVSVCFFFPPLVFRTERAFLVLAFVPGFLRRDAFFLPPRFAVLGIYFLRFVAVLRFLGRLVSFFSLKYLLLMAFCFAPVVFFFRLVGPLFTPTTLERPSPCFLTRRFLPGLGLVVFFFLRGGIIFSSSCVF